MKIHINSEVGGKVTHIQFGEGVITEIADKYITIDFADKKGWKGAKWPHPGILVGERTLCELAFDGPIGNYEFDFEFVGAIYEPNTTNPLHKRTQAIEGMTEKEAAEALKERVTAYGNYEGGFFINKVTQLSPAV